MFEAIIILIDLQQQQQQQDGATRTWVMTMTGKMVVNASMDSFQLTNRHMNSPPA